MATDLMTAMRRAIADCGLSRFELARRTGVAESQLSRFARGLTELRVSSLQKVADVLGLELTVRPKRRRKG